MYKAEKEKGTMRYVTEQSESDTPVKVRVTVESGNHVVLEVQIKRGSWSPIVELREDGTRTNRNCKSTTPTEVKSE